MSLSPLSILHPSGHHLRAAGTHHPPQRRLGRGLQVRAKALPTHFQSAHPADRRSVWVFLLLSVEAIKTYRAHPSFNIHTLRIPTWTTPLALMLAISFLVPSASLLGHAAGALVGYGWGLGALRVLVPPERLTRWLEDRGRLLQRVPH
ncbi:MAG: hypothetical protein INR71_13940, partial [Terriglobus roseus]|nr:hypothetical protein [Terriglobus roseus]